MKAKAPRVCPAIFRGDSVRAILAGRKRATRRLIKPTPLDAERVTFGRAWNVGDTLWVRETWGYRGGVWSSDPATPDLTVIHYRADDSRRDIHHETKGWAPPGLPRWAPPKKGGRRAYEVYCERYWRSWRLSTFMPRWAARIFLRVESRSVERLQDGLTEHDAILEGVVEPDELTPGVSKRKTFRGGFRRLWDQIHGHGAPWRSNPWVFAYRFEVVAVLREPGLPLADPAALAISAHHVPRAAP